MKNIADSGRTVLFVSHQMATVENLCKSAFLLNEGKIIFAGKSSAVISKYRDSIEEFSSLPLLERTTREGSGKCKLAGVELRNENNKVVDSLVSGKPAAINLRFKICQKLNLPMSLSLGVSTSANLRIAHLCMKTFGKWILPAEQDSFEVCLKLPKLELNQGKYYITTFLDDETGEIIDWVTGAFVVNVMQADFYGTGVVPLAYQSPVLLEHSFSI